jgi:hypothetical protein
VGLGGRRQEQHRVPLERRSPNGKATLAVRGVIEGNKVSLRRQLPASDHDLPQVPRHGLQLRDTISRQDVEQRSSAATAAGDFFVLPGGPGTILILTPPGRGRQATALLGRFHAGARLPGSTRYLTQPVGVVPARR